MKKIYFIAMCLLLPFAVNAAKIGSKKVINNVCYQIISDKMVGVVDIKDNLSIVKIPEVVAIDGFNYVVTEIINAGRSGSNKITSIELPNSIQAIGESAFKDFKTLHTINIPSGVQSIASKAFQGCGDLRSIELPVSLKIIKPESFAGTGLTEIVIPYYVTEISKDAFRDCKHLRKVTISSPQCFIGEGAFYGCNRLEYVALPEFLSEKEGKKIFSNYKNINFVHSERIAQAPELTTFDLDSYFLNVPSESLAQDTFVTNTIESTTNLSASYTDYSEDTPINDYEDNYTSSTQPISKNKKIKIGKKFRNNKLEYEITSPTTVKLSSATKNLVSAVNIVVPEYVLYENENMQVTEIGDGAFKGMLFHSPIQNITLPPSIVSIGKLAFSNCTQLKTINLPGTLKRIDEKAFENCSSLSILFIPSSTEVVANNAFKGCNSLSAVAKPYHVSENIFEYKYNIHFMEIDSSEAKQYAQKYNIDYPARVATQPLYAYQAPAQQEKLIAQQPAKTETKKADKEKKKDKKKEQNTSQKSQQTQMAQQSQQSQQNMMASQSTPVFNGRSDVDVNIPRTAQTNESTFAVIIANENYMTEVPVQYAHNDGNSMKIYMSSALGIPESNIRFVKDATRNQILMQIDWLKNVSTAYKGNISVVFYYAGHGMPDESTGNSFLIPTDGSSTSPKTCIPLTELYSDLGDINARHITVLMDACFSGAQRGNGMLMAARGISIKARPASPKGKMIVLSATQEDQTAYPYKEKGHGLFTYFILKKLQESSGKISLGELSDYVKTNVQQRSIVVNNKPQTPNVLCSPSVSKTWRTLPFGSN